VIAVFIVVLVFTGRLIDFQVVRAGELSAAAIANRSMPLTTYGTRGEIVDAFGNVLADSVNRFDITASPRDVPIGGGLTSMVKGGKQVPVTVTEALGAIAGVTNVPIDGLQTALAKDPKSDFAYLVKSVKLDVLTAVRALGIPWVYDDFRPSRTYPNGAVGGNLIGFIGTDGPQAGVELTENKCLASTNGTSTYERGADGVRIPGSTVTRTKSTDGGTLQLTIDRDLQWFTQDTLEAQAKAIGAKWATAVVVRVADAHLMAVADYPTVDPNNVSAASRSALGSLAFSTPYEPGSTFKAMSAAALIDAGVITPETRIVVPARYVLPDHTVITDFTSHWAVRYTAAGVIAYSSNIGISQLSQRLDAQSRYDYMRKFGVGTKTAVHFNGESSGVLSSPSRWDDVTNRTVEFGQGVSATSAQVASIFQTIANGGVKKPLTLVAGCLHPDGTVTDKPSTVGTRVIGAVAAADTLRMMEGVVTFRDASSPLGVAGYRVAAKTGTAQVAENGRYTTRRVISVAGTAPADDPQYVVVVTFGEPTTIGSSAGAAPAFRSILAQVLKKYRVLPTGKPPAPLPVTW
jgi:cell division protein FtsI (penicillin-binding protein 3)